MPYSKTAEKARFNRKVYQAHIFRIRLDSDLAERVAVFKAEGNSLNYLINCLLADYFDTSNPARRRTERLIIKEFYPADNSSVIDSGCHGR